MPGRTVAIVETDDSDDAAKGRRATGARIAPETASIADGILGRCADKRARRVVDSDAEYLRLGPRPESRITLRYLFPFFDLFGSFRSLAVNSKKVTLIESVTELDRHSRFTSDDLNLYGQTVRGHPIRRCENVHLAMRRTLTYPAHFRPRVRQIPDREWYHLSLPSH